MRIGLVLSCLPPAEAVRALVDLANLRGGPDNITVVVARVLGPQIAQAASADHAAGVASRNLRPVHPLLWVLIVVACLAAVGLFALGHIFISLASLVCAAVAGIAALWQRYGGADRRFESDGRRFGRGPYVDCNCRQRRSAGPARRNRQSTPRCGRGRELVDRLEPFRRFLFPRGGRPQGQQAARCGPRVSRRHHLHDVATPQAGNRPQIAPIASYL